ncbi:hypothetical protein EVAR_36103_1 [Eumeta japonica]|uniref:Uncharacterized protein n=1 Tax=Eumeta variegata TaxID=151549 RepID=A0A4C1X194_EUMVA|nr:hypothetical protein EVAR_36103_1 [Eumeta japonica]
MYLLYQILTVPLSKNTPTQAMELKVSTLVHRWWGLLTPSHQSGEGREAIECESERTKGRKRMRDERAGERRGEREGKGERLESGKGSTLE